MLWGCQGWWRFKKKLQWISSFECDCKAEESTVTIPLDTLKYHGYWSCSFVETNPDMPHYTTSTQESLRSRDLWTGLGSVSLFNPIQEQGYHLVRNTTLAMIEEYIQFSFLCRLIRQCSSAWSYFPSFISLNPLKCLSLIMGESPWGCCERGLLLIDLWMIIDPQFWATTTNYKQRSWKVIMPMFPVEEDDWCGFITLSSSRYPLDSASKLVWD